MYNKSKSDKPKKEKKAKRPRSKWIVPFWIFYTTCVLSIVMLFTAISMGWLGFMPSLAELENPETYQASEVYSSDGVLLGKYYFENRSNCKFSDISPALVNALIATEDARFYKHSGIDFRALFRVGFGLLTSNNKGGGSTITQQLAKNLFPRDPNASKAQLVLTKFKEWVVAVKLEHEFSKNEIMALYLNTVDFGNNSMGIKSASKTYFDKTPIELNTEEAALLIGMLKAPSKYSPTIHPNASKDRRNTVLAQMNKYNYLSSEECDSLQQLPIDMSQFSIQDHTAGSATYFREYLRLYLNEWCKNNPKPDGTHYDIYSDGLRIYTTIDSRMQKYAEEAVYEHVCQYLQPMFFDHWKGKENAPFANLSKEETNRILRAAMVRSERYLRMKDAGASEDEIMKVFNTKVQMKIFSWNGLKDTVMTPMDSIRYLKSFLHCGLMAMDVNTGHVKAYVGGTNYKIFQYDHVKLSRRQVGSTFKPYVYTVAMASGNYSPCTMVPNIPVTIHLPDGRTWTPHNSGRYKEGQMMPLREALAMSLNQVSAYIMKQYGPDEVIRLVRRMGMTSDIPAVPAICLGACELSLYEQVGAINCFPNQGVYVEPTFITKICDKEGNVIFTYEPKTNVAIDQITAFKTTRLMQGVVDYGTGGRLRRQYELSFPLGGKTGTTDNQSDGWFVGYSPVLTCGVWVGCEDRAAHFRTTALGQGARTALPVFGLFMQKCYNDPELPYKNIMDNKGNGYYFTVPAAYRGDPNTGCEDADAQESRKPINFD